MVSTSSAEPFKPEEFSDTPCLPEMANDLGTVLRVISENLFGSYDLNSDVKSELKKLFRLHLDKEDSLTVSLQMPGKDESSRSESPQQLRATASKSVQTTQERKPMNTGLNPMDGIQFLKLADTKRMQKESTHHNHSLVNESSRKDSTRHLDQHHYSSFINESLMNDSRKFPNDQAGGSSCSCACRRSRDQQHQPSRYNPIWDLDWNNNSYNQSMLNAPDKVNSSKPSTCTGVTSKRNGKGSSCCLCCHHCPSFVHSNDEMCNYETKRCLSQRLRDSRILQLQESSNNFMNNISKYYAHGDSLLVSENDYLDSI